MESVYMREVENNIQYLGGGFHLFFTPKIGEDEPNLPHIFSTGLKPPTS